MGFRKGLSTLPEDLLIPEEAGKHETFQLASTFHKIDVFLPGQNWPKREIGSSRLEKEQRDSKNPVPSLLFSPPPLFLFCLLPSSRCPAVSGGVEFTFQDLV
jgi:hypothetical protein